MKGGLQTPLFRLEADSRPKLQFDALCHPYRFDGNDDVRLLVALAPARLKASVLTAIRSSYLNRLASLWRALAPACGWLR